MSRFHPSHFLFILIIAIGVAFPDAVVDGLSALTQWFEHRFGWLVLLVCMLFVVGCGYIAFSRYGELRLGGPDEQPQFSYLSWIAMLFAAGIGAGLVFYGAAEPLLHYMNPPPAVNAIEGVAEQARRAMAISYFHWGIHAWCIYAMAALAVAYFAFHRNTPMLPSAPITQHPIGRTVIDSMAIIAVVFGLVSSLCQGVLQVTNGIADGSEADTLTVQLGVLAALFVCYMTSASTSLSKGIKILSDTNIVIAVLFMLFILFAGPTQFIMESFVSGIGDYLDQFFYLSFNVRYFTDAGGWTEDWTITYFLWWIAWAPFVGVFIARISRGRTLREFLLGVVLVPTVFSALWFATLGGTSIHLETITNPGFGAVVESPQATTYALLEALPMAELSSGIMVLLLFIFLVTSADSGTFVLGMFSSHGSLNPSVRQRLFWGVVVGLVTAGSLATGMGLHLYRAITIIGAIPYMFIMCWQMLALIKALREDVSEQA